MGVEPENSIDLGMVDDWYLKLFNSHCGDFRHIEDMLYKAQRKCFENHNMRTLVSKRTMTVLSGESDKVYPSFRPITAQKDFNEAHFIMSTKPYTSLDVERY